MYLQRRRFLNYSFRTIAAAAAGGLLGRLGALTAYAAGNANYKALVGVFLSGGNDGHNVLIPMATGSQNYQTYAAMRGPVAIPQDQLLPIAAAAGDTYGLHPRLEAVQSLYKLNKVAFLANVGNLVVPTTRGQYLAQTVKLPESLFSHSSQMNQWQTATPNDFATTGWGGRAADVLASINAPSLFPMNVIAGGGGIFPVGSATNPATAVTLGLRPNTPVRDNAFQQLLNFSNGVQLMQASNNITKRGINDGALLQSALNNAPKLQTVFPATPLGDQMKLVAQIISVRAALGMTRQIFFVSLGGFDTHGNQMNIQDGLLRDVSQCLGAIYQATVELGIDDAVTTFTNSEFGRTLQSSSGGGTDHAWGSHAMIVGGAVKGGSIYGAFPTLALGGPDDANNRGTIIPTSSVEQYGATLARWFGVPPASIPKVFPTIGNFSKSDLGFMT